MTTPTVTPAAPVDDARIEQIVKRVLDRTVPPNLQAMLAGGFLKLASNANYAVAFGNGTLAWAGGSPFTGTVTVNHDLGRTPLVAVATADLQPGANPTVVHWVTKGSSSVSWRGHETSEASPAAGTLKAFDWLVIG